MQTVQPTITELFHLDTLERRLSVQACGYREAAWAKFLVDDEEPRPIDRS